MQLSFQLTQEPEWNDITLDWLQDYITRYSDLSFKRKEMWSYYNPQTDKEEMIEEIECVIKNVILSFHISIVDIKEYIWWKNPVLVHIDLHKTKGDYEGLGFAVDNMKDFRNGLIDIVEKFKEWSA